MFEGHHKRGLKTAGDTASAPSGRRGASAGGDKPLETRAREAVAQHLGERVLAVDSLSGSRHLSRKDRQVFRILTPSRTLIAKCFNRPAQFRRESEAMTAASALSDRVVIPLACDGDLGIILLPDLGRRTAGDLGEGLIPEIALHCVALSLRKLHRDTRQAVPPDDFAHTDRPRRNHEAKLSPDRRHVAQLAMSAILPHMVPKGAEALSSVINHPDTKPENFILSETGLVAIDLSKPMRGTPEFDLASLLRWCWGRIAFAEESGKIDRPEAERLWLVANETVRLAYGDEHINLDRLNAMIDYQILIYWTGTIRNRFLKRLAGHLDDYVLDLAERAEPA